MKVIDLLIRLQQLPPDRVVMIDQTNEHMEAFKLATPIFCDEITTSLGESVVLISHQPLDDSD